MSGSSLPSPFPSSLNESSNSPSLPLYAILLVIVLPTLCGLCCPALQVMLGRLSERRMISIPSIQTPSSSVKVDPNKQRFADSLSFLNGLTHFRPWFQMGAVDSREQFLSGVDDAVEQSIDVELKSMATADKRRNRSLFAEHVMSSESWPAPPLVPLVQGCTQSNLLHSQHTFC